MAALARSGGIIDISEGGFPPWPPSCARAVEIGAVKIRTNAVAAVPIPRSIIVVLHCKCRLDRAIGIEGQLRSADQRPSENLSFRIAQACQLARADRVAAVGGLRQPVLRIDRIARPA